MLIEIIVEGDFEQRLLHLKVVDTDAGRAFHVNVAPGHEGEAIGDHDAVELVENSVLWLFDVEFEDGFLVGFEVPNEKSGLLNAD